MNTVKKVIKSTSILFLAQIVSYILSFFYTMYIARYLGAEKFGILSFAIAFTGICGILLDFGLSTLMIREVARNKDLAGKYLGNITLIKIMLTLATFGLISIITNIAGYPKLTRQIVYLIALSVIFKSFSNTLNSIFQAFEKIEYFSISKILENSLMFIFILIGIHKKIDIVEFSIIYVFVSIIIVIYSLICTYRLNIEKISIDIRSWIDIIKEALPFGFTVVFVTIYYWIDTVMLSFMKGYDSVGLYSAPYKLTMALLVIPSVVNVVAFPLMSKFYITSKESYKIIYEKYFKYMVIVGIPIGFGTTLLAEKIILFTFGEDYINSASALMILVWSSIFIYIGSPFSRLLESSNRQKIKVVLTGICMLENIFLNVLIIPRYDYIGASFTTALTEFTSLMLGAIICSKFGYGLSKESSYYVIKPIFASVMMSIFLTLLDSMNLLSLILASATFYFITLCFIGGFDQDDTKILFSIFNKKDTESAHNIIQKL